MARAAASVRTPEPNTGAASHDADAPTRQSRKRFRTEDGQRVALASACVDCNSPNVYGLDRCHAHYMREYRRRRAERAGAPGFVSESPKTHIGKPLFNNGKPPSRSNGKPLVNESPQSKRKAPSPEEIRRDYVNKARDVRMYLRAL